MAFEKVSVSRGDFRVPNLDIESGYMVALQYVDGTKEPKVLLVCSALSLQQETTRFGRIAWRAMG